MAKKVTKKTKKKTASKQKPKTGRPQKITFDTQLLTCIEQLKASGKTNNQIAEILGISKDTFYRYIKQFEAFSDSIQNGLSMADQIVEQAIFSRAIGHYGKETKIATNNGMITDSVDVDKWYPPDVKAGIFWLTNRQSSKWRDRVEQEVSVKHLEPVIIEDDNGATTTLTMKEGTEDDG